MAATAFPWRHVSNNRCSIQSFFFLDQCPETSFSRDLRFFIPSLSHASSKHVPSFFSAVYHTHRVCYKVDFSEVSSSSLIVSPGVLRVWSLNLVTFILLVSSTSDKEQLAVSGASRSLPPYSVGHLWQSGLFLIVATNCKASQQACVKSLSMFPVGKLTNRIVQISYRFLIDLRHLKHVPERSSLFLVVHG